MRSAPAEEAVEGDQLVGDDDDPEHDLVADFPDLVAEVALGEECTGPAADQFEEVKGGFGCAPGAGLGPVLVDHVDEVSEGAENTSRPEQQPWVERERELSQREDRYGEQGDPGKELAAEDARVRVERLHAFGAIASLGIGAERKDDHVSDCRRPLTHEKRLRMHEHLAILARRESEATSLAPLDDRAAPPLR